MLLGERRTPKEELLDTVAEMISERLPDIPVYKVGDGFLPDIRSAVSSGEGHMAILVYGPRFYSSESEYVDSLPEDILVFCTQELCHQVPAVFRRKSGSNDEWKDMGPITSFPVMPGLKKIN